MYYFLRLATGKIYLSCLEHLLIVFLYKINKLYSIQFTCCFYYSWIRFFSSGQFSFLQLRCLVALHTGLRCNWYHLQLHCHPKVSSLVLFGNIVKNCPGYYYGKYFIQGHTNRILRDWNPLFKLTKTSSTMTLSFACNLLYAFFFNVSLDCHTA